MEFTFDYKPEAKQRPRFGSRGKVYDPQRTKSLGYKWEASQQMRSQGSETPLESHIFARMRFEMPMPKSWPKKRKKEKFGKPMTSKPDIDNICKFALDVLNGIAYHDDKQVSSVYLEKVWAYEGKTTINLQENAMTLQEEIEILAQSAVKSHAALDGLYHWSVNLEKTHPNSSLAIACAQEVRRQCLEGGLAEIYEDLSA